MKILLMVHGSWMLPMEYLCILVPLSPLVAPSQSVSSLFQMLILMICSSCTCILRYLNDSFRVFLFVFFTMNCFVFTLKCLSVFRWASWWKEVHHDVRRPGIFLCLLPLISIWDSIHLMCRLLNLWICLSFAQVGEHGAFFQGDIPGIHVPNAEWKPPWASPVLCR